MILPSSALPSSETSNCFYELTEFIGLIRWKLDLWFFVKSHCLLLKPGSLLANISGALPFTARRKEFSRTVATWHLAQTLSFCIFFAFTLFFTYCVNLKHSLQTRLQRGSEELDLKEMFWRDEGTCQIIQNFACVVVIAPSMTLRPLETYPKSEKSSIIPGHKVLSPESRSLVNSTRFPLSSTLPDCMIKCL